jgi:tetratricopeptide (TPR) repeat protein
MRKAMAAFGRPIKSVQSLCLLLALLSAIGGCSVKHMAVDQIATMVDTGMTAFEADDDMEMLKSAFPGNIKLLEALLVNQPDNYTMHVLLARLYGSYAFAFPETEMEVASLAKDENGSDENPAVLRTTADRYYQKGAAYALAALELKYPGIGHKLEDKDLAAGSIAAIQSPEIPALFWYGFNLGAHVNLNKNSVQALSRAHLAVKAMNRVIELDPAYYHGGAHLFFMVWYGARSPMMGGNQEKAKRHYKEASAISGKSLSLADLYYARYCLYRAGDREAFLKTLGQVIDRRDKVPALRMLNTVAAVRAKAYLAAVDAFFD